MFWIYKRPWIAWQSPCYLLPIDKVSILNCWWWRCKIIKYLWLKKMYSLHLISKKHLKFSFTFHQSHSSVVFLLITKLRLRWGFSLLIETFEANTSCHQIIFYYLHAGFFLSIFIESIVMETYVAYNLHSINQLKFIQMNRFLRLVNTAIETHHVYVYNIQPIFAFTSVLFSTKLCMLKSIIWPIFNRLYFTIHSTW